MTTKTYKLNEIVLYRNELKNEVKWLKAKIVGILSKSRYKIELTKRSSRRGCHGGQLRTFNENKFHNLPTTTPRVSTQTEMESVPSHPTSRHRNRDIILHHDRRTSSSKLNL